MKRRAKVVEPIQAAGGIVMRGAAEPLIAVVQLRKDKAWVLPKGKLKPDEDPLAAAKREVREETGYDVVVYEHLGAMSHMAGGRPKVTQFWRMRMVDGRARKLMRDVRVVKWLTLEQAIGTLTHAHERAFLAKVGPTTVEAAAHDTATGPAKRTGLTLLGRLRAWLARLIGRAA